MITLGNLKDKVLLQRDKILKALKRLKREDPFTTTDRSIIVEPGTDAADLFSHERIAILEKKLRSDLGEIERAIAKIKKGTYGICETCGAKIDMARLNVKPSAIYCLKCKKEVEAKKR